MNFTRIAVTISLLLALPAVVQAQFTSTNGLVYTTNNGTIMITGYTGPGGAVTIPDTMNGLPVTYIGDGAFSYCTNLISVTIGTNLTSIGDYAFDHCSNLTSITVPNSVSSIGQGAFWNCISLTNVSIGNGVNSIPSSAFVACISLTSVIIPAGVTNIGGGGFYNCSSLTRVQFNGNAPSLGPNVFMLANKATVYYMLGTTGWGSTFGGLPTVIMEFGYTIINGNAITITAYSGQAGSEVSIPNNMNGVPVTTIGNSVFAYCTSLTRIIVPSSVTEIGDNAFFGCTRLSSITIPSSVASIGANTFQWCDSLTSITIPNSVTSIGGFAFFGCTSLSEVYFTGNAPSVGSYLFTYASPVVYYLPGTTGWSNTFGGVPAVLWNPTMQTTDASFAVVSNQFGFNVTGTANIPIVVEACTNLSKTNWTALQSCSLTNGLIYFSDPQWTNYTCRFYRIRSP
jgi:hypothetical protein